MTPPPEKDLAKCCRQLVDSSPPVCIPLSFPLLFLLLSQTGREGGNAFLSVHVWNSSARLCFSFVWNDAHMPVFTSTTAPVFFLHPLAAEFLIRQKSSSSQLVMMVVMHPMLGIVAVPDGRQTEKLSNRLGRYRHRANWMM